MSSYPDGRCRNHMGVAHSFCYILLLVDIWHHNLLSFSSLPSLTASPFLLSSPQFPFFSSFLSTYLPPLSLILFSLPFSLPPSCLPASPSNFQMLLADKTTGQLHTMQFDVWVSEHCPELLEGIRHWILSLLREHPQQQTGETNQAVAMATADVSNLE